MTEALSYDQFWDLITQTFENTPHLPGDNALLLGHVYVEPVNEETWKTSEVPEVKDMLVDSIEEVMATLRTGAFAHFEKESPAYVLKEHEMQSEYGSYLTRVLEQGPFDVKKAAMAKNIFNAYGYLKIDKKHFDQLFFYVYRYDADADKPGKCYVYYLKEELMRALGRG